MSLGRVLNRCKHCWVSGKCGECGLTMDRVVEQMTPRERLRLSSWYWPSGLRGERA